MANGNGDVQAEILAATTIPRMPMPRLSEGLHNVELYFISLEYWFEASSVTSDGKRFNAVMAQIPLNDLGTIQTEIGTIPPEGKYEHIKPIIIAHFSDSQQKRFREAINDVQLGDAKPSQLYQRMKRLASDSLTETALIDLWAARLPEMAHAAVIQMKDSPIKDRLVAADALVDSLRLRNIGDVNIRQASNRPTTTNAVSDTATKSMPKKEDDLLEKLCKQIAEMERKIGNISNQRGRSKSRDSQHGNRNRSKSNCNHENCWYHWKFGLGAKQCRKPCSFVRTDNNRSDEQNIQN